MAYPDSANRPWKGFSKKAKASDDKKNTYEPNLDATAREFAEQGFVTLAAADPDSYRYPDRPLIGEPVDEYPMGPFWRW